jgi:hypothetical protein
MANLAAVVKELEQERNRLDEAVQALRKLAGRNQSGNGRVRPMRTMSAAARRRISAAQKARWAKWKTQQRKKAA